MTKPLHPPAQVSIYGLVYLLISIQLPMDLTGEFRFVLSGLLFAPLLAAWLGWRFGRRGLLPLWLPAPLTLPEWDLDVSYDFGLQIGLGLALFGLCALVTLVFAARRGGAAQAEGAAPVWLAISAGLLVLAAGYAEAGASIGSSGVSVGADAPWGMAVITFGLIVLRRCPAVFAALAVAVISGAGYALNLLTDIYWNTESGSWTYAVHAAAGWGMRAPEAFSFGIAAIYAGLIVRDWPGLAEAARVRGRAAAGLAILLIVPPLVLASELMVTAALDAPAPEAESLLIPGAPGSPALVGASMLAGPVSMQSLEEIVVTASTRRSPAAQTVLGHPAAGHLLALFSLVLGAALTGRASFWLPQGVVVLTVLMALGVERASYGPGYLEDYYFAEGFIRDSLSAVLWAAFACWTFVWLGMRARLRGQGEGGRGT